MKESLPASLSKKSVRDPLLLLIIFCYNNQEMARRIRQIIILFIIGAATLAALLYCAGLRQIYRVILNISPQQLLIPLALSGLTWVFLTLRLTLFVRQAGSSISLFDLFRMHISSYALNCLLPAKLGDVALAGFLTVKGIPLGRAAAIVLQVKVLDLLAVTIFIIPAFVMFTGREAPPWMTSAFLICIAIIAVPMGIIIIDRQMKLGGFLEKLRERLSGRILKMAAIKSQEAYCAYHDIMSDRKLLISSIILSLLVWFNYGLICCTTARAAGITLTLAAGLGAMATANIGKGLTPVPGGTGIYEGILAGTLALFGVPFDAAIVIAVLDHFIKKVLTLLIGLPATAALGMDIKGVYDMQKVEEGRSH